MPLEDWNTVLQFASAILLGLTFAVGAGAIWTGYVLGKRQEGRIAATERSTASANERAANAEKETARLNKVAEEERLARVKIEERLAWRRISPAKHTQMLAALSQFAGSVVIVNGHGGEPESESFARDIAKTLQDAHWNVTTNSWNDVPAPVGLRCLIDTTTPAGAALAHELSSLPTAVIVPTPTAQIGGNPIAGINVGLRPPP